MATKDEIRPIYTELQGRLLQAPGEGPVQATRDSGLWERHNQLVADLTKLTQCDYSGFQIRPRRGGSATAWMYITGYRTTLSGLIGKLHAEFFPDEPSPFADSPGVVVSQTQQQSQVVHVQMIMELTEQLTRSEAKFKEGSKERGFIDKAKDCLKSAVGGTISMAQLMLLLLNVAKECGLNVEDMVKIFAG